MTLNSVIALILRFSPNSIALQADYVTVVEDGPIMSVYCLPVPVFHFWPKLTHPAARSLCNSWAYCNNGNNNTDNELVCTLQQQNYTVTRKVNFHFYRAACFQSIIARSSSALTPSGKSSINANRKSTTRFPMRLRWSSYVASKSPKGGIKNAKRPISMKKMYFAWRKSATKFLCVKTVSGKVVRHSLA